MFLPLENNPDSLVLNLSLNLRVDTAIDSLDNMEKNSVKYMAAKFFQESSHAPMAYPRSFSNSWDRQRCPKQAYEHITPSPNTHTHTHSAVLKTGLYTLTHCDRQLSSQQAYVPQVPVWNPFLLYGEIIVNPSVQMQIGLGGESLKRSFSLPIISGSSQIKVLD